MKELDYYKSNEILNNKYYQVPQELFESSLYKDKLNSDSKILYAFILDRLSLSNKNHWFDSDNRVYLIFKRQEVCDKLRLSEKTVTKAFKQLSDVNLIEEKRQGLGKPNLIYVGKIQHEEIINEEVKPRATKNEIVKVEKMENEIQEQENLQVQNRKIYGSGVVENTVQEQEKFPTINTNNINTKIINTDSINPNSEDEKMLDEIKIKCKLNEVAEQEKIVLEDIIEGLYYRENLKVGNEIINHSKILDKLNLIVKDNLIKLLEILRNTPNIQNVKNYLMICLYNNLGNTHIATQEKSPCSYNKEIQRIYPSDFWDKFYANFSYEQAVAN